MAFNNEIEEVKAQIKVLEKKLSFLEELEKTKSPVEEAFKDWWGQYPETGTWDGFDEKRWQGFQAGYEFAYQEKIMEKVQKEQEVEPSMTNCVITGNPPDGYVTWQEWYNELGSKGILHNLRISSIDYKPTPQEPEEQKWDAVRESVKWCEEHPNENPLDYLKPQTPEQVADGLKEAFREAVKQGVVSSTKRQTLTDLIYDWWEDVFATHSDWDMETSIDNLVDEISLWLPTEHETNSYKWNECIRMIREKLR